MLLYREYFHPQAYAPSIKTRDIDLLIAGRRPTPEKQTKDKQAAVKILLALIDKGEQDVLRDTFRTMPQRWRTKVKAQLTDPLDRRILEALGL